mgnify:CR=1 FL=1
MRRPAGRLSGSAPLDRTSLSCLIGGGAEGCKVKVAADPLPLATDRAPPLTLPCREGLGPPLAPATAVDDVACMVAKPAIHSGIAR